MILRSARCFLTRQMCSSAMTHPTVQSFIKNVSTKDMNSENSQLIHDIRNKMTELDQLAVLRETEELKNIAEQDMKIVQEELQNLQSAFIDNVLEPEPLDNSDSLVLEIAAGVGGQESMLFANDLLSMYSNYAEFNGWNFEHLNIDNENEFLRHASILIEGHRPYKALKYEAGVHRVQRVPKTEKSGRIHTSTASVAILPSPQNTEKTVNMNDIKVETKRASGAGGQHVNKTESAIRMIHLPTNIVVECQKERSQIKNRSLALKILVARLYEKELQEQTKGVRDLRKLQVGIVDRSRKIRTYNFVQDRVTDHRIGYSNYALRGVLEGSQEFHKFVSKLTDFDRIERIVQYCNTLQSPS